MRPTWNSEQITLLRRRANEGKPVTEIAAELGKNPMSVRVKAAQEGIAVTRHTSAELQEVLARVRARDAKKKRRKAAAKRIAVVKAAPVAMNRTSAEYRRMLPPVPEMTKGELRRFLHAAVLNTEGARL